RRGAALARAGGHRARAPGRGAARLARRDPARHGEAAAARARPSRGRGGEAALSAVRSAVLTLLCVALTGAPAAAELYVWVDAEGRTHVTDDPAKVPAEARARDAGEAGLDALWGGRVRGPTPPPAARG